MSLHNESKCIVTNHTYLVGRYAYYTFHVTCPLLFNASKHFIQSSPYQKNGVSENPVPAPQY